MSSTGAPSQIRSVIGALKRVRKKNLFFVAILGVIFFEILIVFPNKLETQEESSMPTEATESSGTRYTDQKMQGVHLVESTRGFRDWELFANAAEGYQSQGSWLLRDVKVRFYGSNNMTFTVTGREGTIDADSKDMIIQGNVKTTSSNGYVFETELVNYKARERRIHSPGTVKVQGPDDQMGKGLLLLGTGMTADVDNSEMSILENVRGSKQLKDGKVFLLSSQRADLSGRSMVAKLLGDVKITYGAMEMRGPEAEFIYSKDNKLMNQLSILKGANVQFEDKRATSERLDLDLISNKFVFKGKPVLYQGEDQLMGDQIVLLDGGKKVKVEKVKASVTEK